jgi:hypothetical protein
MKDTLVLAIIVALCERNTSNASHEGGEHKKEKK